MTRFFLHFGWLWLMPFVSAGTLFVLGFWRKDRAVKRVAGVIAQFWLVLTGVVVGLSAVGLLFMNIVNAHIR